MSPQELELARLTQVIEAAQRERHAYLIETYPVGTVVGVRLSAKQVNPTWGTVRAHWGSAGQLAVELRNTKPRSRRPIRHIDWRDVMEVQS